jgi:class 3 adenylate cyclase
MDIMPFLFLLFHAAFATIALLFVLIGTHNLELSSRKEFILNLQLQKEQKRSEYLLHNVLPESIANKLHDTSEEAQLVDYREDVTVLFADLVGFTALTAKSDPHKTIATLSKIFRRFDAIIEQIGVEKIKTIGDAYMVASGIPDPTPHHIHKIAEVALEMREAVNKINHLLGHELELRIGMHTGPVLAGVLGTKRFLYDLWGDTVNIASRMESHGIPGEIQITEEVTNSLRGKFEINPRGRIDVKGRGSMNVYLLGKPILKSPQA